MNRVAYVVSTLFAILALPACSEEAVVGDQNPITCGGGMGGSIDGTVFLPGQQVTASLGAVSDVTFTSNIQDTVLLTVPEGVFHIDFYCGPATTGTYVMMDPTDNAIALACPNAVTAYFTAGNDFVPVVEGTLVVDEVINAQQVGECFSGRFAGTFGEFSEALTGWFRTQ